MNLAAVREQIKPQGRIFFAEWRSRFYILTTSQFTLRGRASL
jgi:hypothetical protein